MRKPCAASISRSAVVSYAVIFHSLTPFQKSNLLQPLLPLLQLTLLLFFQNNSEIVKEYRYPDDSAPLVSTCTELVWREGKVRGGGGRRV